MYEAPKLAILLFLKEDIVRTSDGFGGEWSDENVDQEGWA